MMEAVTSNSLSSSHRATDDTDDLWLVRVPKFVTRWRVCRGFRLLSLQTDVNQNIHVLVKRSLACCHWAAQDPLAFVRTPAWRDQHESHVWGVSTQFSSMASIGALHWSSTQILTDLMMYKHQSTRRGSASSWWNSAMNPTHCWLWPVPHCSISPRPPHALYINLECTVYFELAPDGTWLYVSCQF